MSILEWGLISTDRNLFHSLLVKNPYFFWVLPQFVVVKTYFIELDDGKIYRKALYLMVKTMVSYRFSLKPIHWLLVEASTLEAVGSGDEMTPLAPTLENFRQEAGQSGDSIVAIGAFRQVTGVPPVLIHLPSGKLT